MIRICTSLSETDFEVELVGRKKRQSVPLKDEVFAQKRLSCIFSKGKLFYIEYNVRLFFYLLFKRSEAFSAVDLDTLVACALAAKLKRKKLVFDAHEYFEEVPEVTNRQGIKNIWKFIANIFIPQVDLAYTVNRALAALFTQKYSTHFEVIRSVPYPYGNLQRQPTQIPIVLYQGALNKGRGLEQLIKAMHNINAECWIAGEGDLSGSLRTLVVEENLKHKVKFLGYVQPDELKHITAKATVGYNVMENIGLSYYYSLANKFFDYIQAEVPQICSPFPEYEHILQKYKVGLMCNCTEAEIENTINKLLTNTELYNTLQAECKIAKRIFNWEDEDEKLKSMYLNIVSK